VVDVLLLVVVVAFLLVLELGLAGFGEEEFTLRGCVGGGEGGRVCWVLLEFRLLLLLNEGGRV